MCKVAYPFPSTRFLFEGKVVYYLSPVTDLSLPQNFRKKLTKELEAKKSGNKENRSSLRDRKQPDRVLVTHDDKAYHGSETSDLSTHQDPSG